MSENKEKKENKTAEKLRLEGFGTRAI